MSKDQLETAGVAISSPHLSLDASRRLLEGSEAIRKSDACRFVSGAPQGLPGRSLASTTKTQTALVDDEVVAIAANGVLTPLWR